MNNLSNPRTERSTFVVFGAILNLLLFSARCAVEPTCYRGAIKPKIAVNSLYRDSSRVHFPSESILRYCRSPGETQVGQDEPHAGADHAEILYTYCTVTTQKYRNHPLM